jgi:hypothetical protein
LPPLDYPRWAKKRDSAVNGKKPKERGMHTEEEFAWAAMKALIRRAMLNAAGQYEARAARLRQWSR